VTPAAFIERLAASVAQHPLVALPVAIAGGIVSGFGTGAFSPAR